MAGGRALNWRIDAADRSAIADVAKIGKRGRLVIPRELATDLPWCHGGDALIAMHETGRIRVAQWDPEGVALAQRRLQMRARAEAGDKDAQASLLNMESTFVRLAFEQGRRLTLPMIVLTHLRVDADSDVFCLRSGRDLEVWSPEYRDKRLVRDVA